MGYSVMPQERLIDGAYVYGIPLTRGYFALIDFEDADLAAFKWHANTCKHPYAMRRSLPDQNNKRRHISMSRVILQRKLGVLFLEPGLLCDHASLNVLDNRRANLRLATRAQNAQNQETHERLKLGKRLKGAHFRKATGKWRSTIRVVSKDIYLGTFDTEQEAHAAYVKAARKHFGEFARGA